MQAVTYRRWLKVVMWTAVAVGAYSRLRGLGTWPWAEDEYYIAQSVSNIIQHGVPAFNCGGYYMRALTLQYLIAPLFALGVDAELAARLVTVAFSFAVLPAVYLLGKRLSSVTVACISVGLISISLWEIEFARFARMYVPFQAIFLWYLLMLHRVVIDRKSAAYGWLWALSALGVLTWAGGLFLLVVNFIPIFMERAPGRARHLAINLGLLVLGYLYSAWNFRFMGSTPPLPSDVPVNLGGSQFVLPPVLAPTLASYPAWIPGALVMIVLSLLAVVVIARDSAATVRERAAWIALIALSTVNLFGCVLIGLALALWLEWINARQISRRGLVITALALAVNFVYWLCYAFFTTGWHHLFPGFGPGGELSKLLVVLFKYPNIFDPIIFPWLAVLPALTIALGVLLTLAAAWAAFGKTSEHLCSLRLTLAVCLIMAALIAVAETKYIRTRYTFFLLPVLYLVAVTVIHTLLVRLIRSRPKRGMALASAMLVLVTGTGDFGWAHMIHVDRMDWNYRLHLNEGLTEHYYPRQDYRTPAQYVNHRARPDDTIIVASPVVAYYLKRTDYIYWNFRWGEFTSFSCDRGQHERWSGARLLYTSQSLWHVIDQASHDIWLIARLGWRLPPENELSRRYSQTLVYRGFAGKIAVYKIHASRRAPPPSRPADSTHADRSGLGSMDSYRRGTAIARLIGAGR